jgi:uncharacterized membrane protein YqgA involved in biofilm formation
MFVGFGTVANVATVVAGSGLGLLVGHRLSPHVRTTVTSALGLVTLLIAGQAAVAVSDTALSDAVGDSAPMLIVLGSLVVGGIVGAVLRLEERIEALGGWLQSRLSRGHDAAAAAGGDPRDRFVEGFVVSSLVFCIGPLTILGSLNEGLGNGADQLLLKATLDGFAALAFAASFGVGVMASALSVGLIQGSLTLLGALLGSFLPDAHLAVLTATGGLILIGVAMRLLDLRTFAVADLLPALVVAPVLCQIVIATR